MLVGERLHGGALDGSEIFKDTMPIMYEEYMITPFIMTPMLEEQLKRVIKEKISQKLDQENSGKSQEEKKHAQYILERTFDKMFTFLHN